MVQKAWSVISVHWMSFLFSCNYSCRKLWTPAESDCAFIQTLITKTNNKNCYLPPGGGNKPPSTFQNISCFSFGFTAVFLYFLKIILGRFILK